MFVSLSLSSSHPLFSITTMFDAHCHPTDTPDTLDLIPSMKTDLLACMSTNFQDIERVESIADWPKVVPCFGYHPWFTWKVYTEEGLEAKEHYSRVLAGPRGSEEELQGFVASQEQPMPFSNYLDLMRQGLEKYPNGMIGEAGLDKPFRVKDKEGDNLTPFRVSLDHQRTILGLQLQLAVDYGRPISLHGVQCHGALLECVTEILKKNPGKPLTVCLHSYSGPPDFLVGWFKLEGSKKKPTKVRVFVSVSSVITCGHIDREGDRFDQKLEKISPLLAKIPDDRLLIESDYYKAGPVMDDLMQEVLDLVAHAKGVSKAGALEMLDKNSREFLDYRRE